MFVNSCPAGVAIRSARTSGEPSRMADPMRSRVNFLSGQRLLNAFRKGLSTAASSGLASHFGVNSSFSPTPSSRTRHMLIRPSSGILRRCVIADVACEIAAVV
jgi:hypothetical protein